jgi:hypothetical protein
MKVFQVLVYGQLDSLDYDEVVNLATSPNPVFRSWAGAAAWVRDEVNLLIKEANEGEKPEDHHPFFERIPFNTMFGEKGEVSLVYEDEATGVTYMVVETDLND